MSSPLRHSLQTLLVISTMALLASCADNGNGGGVSANVLPKQVSLTGAQENPAVATAANGAGFISVDPASGEVRGSVTTFGVTGTAAHIHSGATGVNGPILIELTQDPPGTWSVPNGATLTSGQIDSFRASALYVNVHSAANPGGEARGQIGPQIFFATLTGAQETPPITTAAGGTGRFAFDPLTRTLSGTVTTAGVTGTAAHIHTAAVGVAGPVTIALAGGPVEWTLPPTVLTEAQVGSLAGASFYANVHSAANPGGEIRGQLYLPAKGGNLSGAEETPPVMTSATGVGWLAVNPFTKAVVGRVETTGISATAAHVHVGAVGVPGPIVIPLTSPTAGVWVTAPATTITDAALASFMRGELYFNVHSAMFPGGEIRGQIVAGR